MDKLNKKTLELVEAAGVEWGEEWPSRGGKFSKGEVVEVSPKSTSTSLHQRYRSWEGVVGIVTSWKKSGTEHQQSEYRVLDPLTGKSRWIYADVLKSVKLARG